jgi:predicted phage terminase large subunit-like protein
MNPKRPAELNHYITTDWALGEKNYNDYSVLLPFGVDEADNIWMLPDVVRIKATPEIVVERLLDMAVRLKPVQIGIEASHITKTIGPFLKRRMMERKIYCPLWDGVPSKDKVARCASIRGRMQQGKVFLPDTPFYREVVFTELMQFAAGRHDDVVDCFAWAGIMLDTLRKAPSPPGPPPEEDPPWSMAWMQKRIASSAPTRSAAPPRFNGKPREKRKVPSWNS